jgi:hypothetical protein
MVEDPMMKWKSTSVYLSERNFEFMISDALALRKRLSHGFSFADACPNIQLYEKLVILQERYDRRPRQK